MLNEKILPFVKEITLADDSPENPFGSISLIKMIQKDGSTKWKVSRGNSDLSKRIFLFCISPLPSSRDSDYLEEFRFDSPEEGLSALKQFFVVAKRDKITNAKMLEYLEQKFQEFLNKTNL